MRSVGFRHSGYTLVELMVVVLLAGVLISAATPMVNAYSSQRGSLQLQARFLESLATAQEAALNSGEVVSICASNDGKTCKPDGWERGWLVYQGSESSSFSDAQIIEHFQPQSSDAKVSVVNEHIEDLSSIRFTARGFSENRVLASFCQKDALDSRVLLIERTGRFRAILKLEEMNADFKAGLPAAEQICARG